jgi:hypothetical protein
MARRALEIGAAVAAAGAVGLPVAFCTLTMRHGRSDSLAKCWDALAAGWGRSTSGCKWDADRRAFGVRGYVRVVEVTHGRNGWHVHVHALLFAHGFTSDDDVDDFMRPMWGRWSKGVQSAGMRAPLPVASEWHRVGGDLAGTALGDYLAKGAAAAGSIGAELTQTQSKVARSVHGTDSHWSILRDGPVNGEVAALARWWEWERASKGRRQIAWSQGLRDELGVGIVEKSDDEIAAEQVGTDDDTVVWITRPGWAWLVANPSMIGPVLTSAENMGVAEFSAWLWSHGIEHRRT